MKSMVTMGAWKRMFKQQQVHIICMECDDGEFNELNATGLKRRIHRDLPAGTPLPRSYTSQYSVRKI